MNWPRGKRHLVTRGLTILIVNTIALLLVGELMNGIRFTGNVWENIVAAAAGDARRRRASPSWCARSSSWPWASTTSSSPRVLTVLFMGLTLLIGAAGSCRASRSTASSSAFIASILIAAINTVLVGIIGLDEDESFFRHSMKRMARVGGDVDDRPGPGLRHPPDRRPRRAHPARRAAHRLHALPQRLAQRRARIAWASTRPSRHR